MGVRRVLVAAAVVHVAWVLAAAPAGASERTVVMRAGPFSLGAYQTINTVVKVSAPQRGGYLREMHAVVVDATGRRVAQTRVMLHHVVFVNSGRFDGDRNRRYCEDRRWEPFYGSAEEDQALRLPAGYGYRVRRGDRWRMRVMLMDHRADAARVWVRYRMVIDDQGTAVQPYWISVACNRDRIFNVPGGAAAGSVVHRRVGWRVPRSGRIIAIAGHLHGGGRRLAVTERSCGDRLLAAPTARYGRADDPIYALRPVLHEPSPRSVSVLTSATGWRVDAGETLQIDAEYDGALPHVKVMGIAHLYIALGESRASPCGPLPRDVREDRLAFRGRPGVVDPPPVTQQLSRRQSDGSAVPIATLPGPLAWFTHDATITERDYAFSPRHISVPAGATVLWRFRDPDEHDVTWANGPRGFASRYLRRGRSYSHRFTVPGTYQAFCSLHPVDMSLVIDVRPTPPRR